MIGCGEEDEGGDGNVAGDEGQSLRGCCRHGMSEMGDNSKSDEYTAALMELSKVSRTAQLYCANALWVILQ